MIAASLSPQDIGSLRVCCKSLEQQLFDVFANRTFTGVCIKFTVEHLESMVELTEHAQFLQRVHTIRYYSHIRGAPVSDDDAVAYHNKLGRAMTKFPNLETIAVMPE
jgi:hypothetical protein